MSAKIEKRHVADCYRVEVVNHSREQVRFVVHGNTKSGRQVEIKIDTSWYQWRCLASKFSKAWADQRASRVSEMQRIDSALPRELQ